MKKLALLLTIVILYGCKKEEQTIKTPTPIKTCDCQKQTWIKRSIELPIAWRWNGGTEFYSNNCADNGRVVGGYSGNGYDIEYRIKCN